MDLFENHRRPDGGQSYDESRVSRRQLLDDRAFYNHALRYIYEAGDRGVSMEKLARHGIQCGWWQDTVGKHWGEKMRMLWAYGVITVPVYPGVTTIRHIRVIHPHFASVTFDNKTIQKDQQRLREMLGRFDWMPQTMNHEDGHDEAGTTEQTNP